MRVVIQRVTEASVTVSPDYRASIGPGMMILVGIETGDSEDDVRWMARKTLDLRIFDDDAGVMNRSISDVGGNILAISQFTLMASTRKGNRPSYIRSARPETARPLYELYCEQLEQGGVTVMRGIFGADMKVALVNDGPVTIIIDSRLKE